MYIETIYLSDTLKGLWIASLDVLPQQLKSFVFAVQFFIFFKINIDQTPFWYNAYSKSEL